LSLSVSVSVSVSVSESNSLSMSWWRGKVGRTDRKDAAVWREGSPLRLSGIMVEAIIHPLY
jgi:hypothetical protein